MKKLVKKSRILLLVLISITLGQSCSDNDNNSFSTSAPVINNVSKADDPDLVPINQGYANNMYIIQGSGFSTLRKIYFNEVDTYFNSTLITDSTIFVTIDENTPYENGTNELKIVTQYGTAIYSFVVAPPAPKFNSFNPINALDGEEIIIYGNYFLDPVVTVGDVEATIVSNSLTEIVAIVPTGSNNKYVTVTTISGESTAVEAIGTAMYDDILIPSMWIGGWGVTNDFAHTTPENVAQGTKSIKCIIEGWSGFQIGGGPAIASNYAGIRFRMKAQNDQEFRVIVNGDWGNEHHRNVTATWQYYFISWADLGLTSAPANLIDLTIGSFSGDTNTYYIDDIGFVLN